MAVRKGTKAFVVGICDDEMHIHDAIKQMLNEYSASNGITVRFIQFFSAADLLKSEDRLDVLLLDIEMPEIDGIEAGYELQKNKVDYKVIMLTAREDRYREAFRIGAFRFVPKPVDKKELYAALDDVREHMISSKEVTVYRDGVSYQIPQENILYIEANKSATLIFTGKADFRSEKPLSSWMEELDERLFFQCHKSYIVNMSKVEDVDKNVITLVSNDKILVSRRLRATFLRAFVTYDTKHR